MLSLSLSLLSLFVVSVSGRVCLSVLVASVVRLSSLFVWCVLLPFASVPSVPLWLWWFVSLRAGGFSRSFGFVLVRCSLLFSSFGLLRCAFSSPVLALGPWLVVGVVCSLLSLLGNARVGPLCVLPCGKHGPTFERAWAGFPSSNPGLAMAFYISCSGVALLLRYVRHS